MPLMDFDDDDEDSFGDPHVEELIAEIKKDDYSLERIRALLDTGTDISGFDECGTTPLAAAARTTHLDIAALLIARGAEVDQATGGRKDSSALIEAVSCGNTPMMQLLLEHEAELDASNRWGYTPLLLAIKYKQPAAIEFLLDQGVDVNARHYHKETPLSFAAGRGEEEIVALLLERGADATLATGTNNASALARAAQNGSIPIMQMLIDHGAAWDAPDDGGRTPLMCALYAEKAAAAQFLIDKGADLTRRDTPMSVEEFSVTDGGVSYYMLSGDTPLILGARSRRCGADMIDRLLKAGADINAANAKGETALIRAAAFDYADSAETLVKNGADLFAKDKDGLTAIDRARKAKHGALALYLENAMQRALENAVRTITYDRQARLKKAAPKFKL